MGERAERLLKSAARHAVAIYQIRQAHGQQYLFSDAMAGRPHIYLQMTRLPSSWAMTISRSPSSPTGADSTCCSETRLTRRTAHTCCRTAWAHIGQPSSELGCTTSTTVYEDGPKCQRPRAPCLESPKHESGTPHPGRHRSRLHPAERELPASPMRPGRARCVSSLAATYRPARCGGGSRTGAICTPAESSSTGSGAAGFRISDSV